MQARACPRAVEAVSSGSACNRPQSPSFCRWLRGAERQLRVDLGRSGARSHFRKAVTGCRAEAPDNGRLRRQWSTLKPNWPPPSTASTLPLGHSCGNPQGPESCQKMGPTCLASLRRMHLVHRNGPTHITSQEIVMIKNFNLMSSSAGWPSKTGNPSGGGRDNNPSKK